MQKAGGIIGLVAGIFGVLAAFITLLAGGMAHVAQADKADTVIYLGWGGVAFSFLTIVLGAVAIGSRGRKVGSFLMLTAVAGAILGGTFVAIFMVLAFIGGLLAIIGARPTGEAVA